MVNPFNLLNAVKHSNTFLLLLSSIFMTHENREMRRSEKVYREIRQEACSPICSINQGRGIFLNPTGSPCKGKEVEALILPLMLTELGAFGQFATY